MAERVVVNTLNGHDMSLKLSTTVEELVDMSPKECTLLIPVITSTCVPFHTAPIQHTSRVTATTAIIGVDFADLHTHSSKKSTIFHAQDTCIFIIMNGYA